MNDDVTRGRGTRMRVVTIARDYDSSGDELAYCLAKRLDWDVGPSSSA